MSKTNKSNDFSCETMLHDDAPRTHLLKVYITDSEAAYIKRAAGGSQLPHTPVIYYLRQEMVDASLPLRTAMSPL